MYTNYAKLWDVLHQKGLTKTDLCRAAGMSSRTLAKLVANRSVTTDTLLAVCETLDCRIEDIMEFSQTPPERTLFSVYRENRKNSVTQGALTVTEFEHLGLRYKIGATVQKANRHTVIHCRPSGIAWEQLYPIGHLPLSESHSLCAASFAEKGKVCIVLISGSPANITGLDEGIFRSVKRDHREGGLFVMSASAFKLFRAADNS